MEKLDTDLLRTFLAIADAGSFLGGAARIFRSQSAASMQIKKLEDVLGAPVFIRHGRGVKLAPLGEKLEPVARRTIVLLDDALDQIRGDGLAGSLRVGIPDDQSRTVLARIIGDFAGAHPSVELSVHCALSSGFSKALKTGELDLAVHEVESLEAGMIPLRREKLVWTASRAHHLIDRDPLPVAVFDRACWWRDMSLRLLQAAGRQYRIVYSSESTTGIVAAIEAGIAVGLLGESSLNDRLKPLSSNHGLPIPPASHLVIEFSPSQESDIRRAMTDTIRQAFGSA
ncbi:LysR family transcriptional regulator [Hoeflea prorocentri]|uniref:LysR substrate-binding domain-containing protein n=1 Tax=Hoeflea prorocentri TaxID=1922333 RepID=A0A9X3UP83_9HYPH|nr:LysR substrate-binding domain-containing protein [Hoeflea prorocentri]MCY6382879.1 LysR substrate-binding domain-containing protein [Hoeflea prorocentri]MDA5400679.1 LysR substrate-binding domain-containing protein [Hoeflea prorocentri]